MGHKDDPQAKVPTSAILTLAILAALEFGGKHAKALAWDRELRLFSYIPYPAASAGVGTQPNRTSFPCSTSSPRSGRDSIPPRAMLWVSPKGYLVPIPIPVCENIRAPRSRLAPGRVYRGYIPSKRVFFHGYKLHLLVDDGRFICGQPAGLACDEPDPGELP